MSTGARSTDRRAFAIAVIAMAAAVAASNVLVQFPVEMAGLQEYLTWGAFTYPIAFLVTDLANRRFGPRGARRVVYVGFAIAVILSVVLATPRIALASGAAFLTAQLLDVGIFHALRERVWWTPPLVSSVVASGVDTLIFFSLAFACGPVLDGATISDLLGMAGIADSCVVLPWRTLALADYGVKLVLAALFIAPYGAMLALMRMPERQAA
jgi:uncharacterized PurR-regulated membrane protein YhhQ (DUF165 family)